jgi:hypothetical protein
MPNTRCTGRLTAPVSLFVGQLATMKMFSTLTEADLDTSAVWRYQSDDGDDRAWVLPEQRSQLSELDTEVFVVSTGFRLADGSELLGVCSPTDPSGLDYLQPVIFSCGRHVPLWKESTVGVPEICDVLQRSRTQVFPIKFHCQVPVDDARLSGIISINEALPNPTLQLSASSLALGSRN